MHKIGFIIPYFGQWPEWMDLYLYSCSRQEMIDFIFYTYCDLPNRIYANTIFHPITFQSYCMKVSETLGVDFSPSNAYKLCDIRPFYGIIHAKDLKDYDWWGYGDIDLVYGDLSLLINEHNLQHYDLLTAHVDRVAGHFTVVRKDSVYTKICFAIPQWKEKLLASENLCLDEGCFSHLVMPFYNKLFGKIYYYLLRWFDKDRKHWFRWWDYWSRLTAILPSHVLMKEFYTSFKPASGTVITYNPQTGEIHVPIEQTDKIPMKAARLYLHFLFFKRTSYWNTEQDWHPGFYKIPLGYDFAKRTIVEITTHDIKIRET